MRRPAGRPLETMEQVAHLEQGRIEGLSVEADQGTRPAQRIADGGQQLALVAVAHEQELPRHERAIGLAPAAADQERVGARPTGEPGRLEVEEDERRTRGRAARHERRLPGRMRKARGDRADLFTAVPARRLVPPFDDITGALPFAAEGGQISGFAGFAGFSRFSGFSGSEAASGLRPPTTPRTRSASVLTASAWPRPPRPQRPARPPAGDR